MKVTVVLFLALIILIPQLSAQKNVNKSYYPSKKIKCVEYLNGKILSKVVCYYENGKKSSESSFDERGSLFGSQIEYFETGGKKSEVFILEIKSIPSNLLNLGTDSTTYVDAITSKKNIFYENGNKKAEGMIVNGMRSGYWLFYTKDGSLEKKEFFSCLTKDGD